jgi:hypothetical protein
MLRQRMNHISIQLTNEAMSAGLALAQQRGAPSLEALIEQLLIESAPDPRRSADPPAAPAARPVPAAAADEPSVMADGFKVNPPALTLDPPAAELPASLAPPDTLAPTALPFLTNRLSPLKASVRALANLTIAEGGWPRLRDFQAKAGHAAREHGLLLLAQDREMGRRGRQKRSVAWPVGANPAAALERFVFAFTVAEDAGRAAGPLATLGLVAVDDGRVALTQAGWDLARAHSPVIDDREGMLGEAEVEILRAQLAAAEPEREAVAEFVRAVRRAAGAQTRIDELLATWHPEWSTDQAAAQRSAMIGRLEELGLLEVQGRGGKAKVSLNDVGAFEEDMNKRSAA